MDRLGYQTPEAPSAEYQNKTQSAALEEVVQNVTHYQEQATISVLQGNYREAVLHLTVAIKLTTSPEEAAELYAQRSTAYRKLKQLYLSYRDAEKVIMLRPDWPKGFICHGEIYMEVQNYDLALVFFGLAVELNPIDVDVFKMAKSAAVLSKRNRIFTNRIPWLGAGIGIILGVSIVIADQVATQKPSIGHPALMVLLVIVVSLMGFGISKGWLYYNRLQLAKQLEPPLDLIEECKVSATEGGEDGPASVAEPANKIRARYSKAQARQRFRKGKF